MAAPKSTKEWMLMTSTEKVKGYSVGELYFEPVKNPKGEIVSDYRGKVAGFIIERDDGTEFHVRAGKSLPYSLRPMTRRDLESLRGGDHVQDVTNNTVLLVTKVFPQFGDVWVRNEETGKHAVMKFNDLRKYVVPQNVQEQEAHI